MQKVDMPETKTHSASRPDADAQTGDEPRSLEVQKNDPELIRASDALPAEGNTEVEQPISQPAPQTGGWLSRIKEVLGLSHGASLRDELEAELDREGDDEDAAFSTEERALLRNILDFRETRVSDVMVPRADIIAVEENIGLADLLKVYQSIGHSRLPVYRQELDDAVGMVHIKDLMSWLVASAEQGAGAIGRLDLGAVNLNVSLAASGIIRRTLYVPSFMPASDLLRRMQASRIQMALVVDEYGGIDGLVSMEDLMETIVGEIDDEHDEEEAPDITTSGGGIYTVDARAELEDVVDRLGPAFPVDHEEEDVDTIGGFIVTMLGRIPARGEFLEIEEVPGFVFEVLDADQRRLKRVKIYAPEATATANERRRWRESVTAGPKGTG